MGLAEELLSHVTPSHGLWRHEELVEIGHAPSGLKSWSEKYSTQDLLMYSILGNIEQPEDATTRDTVVRFYTTPNQELNHFVSNPRLSAIAIAVWPACTAALVSV